MSCWNAVPEKKRLGAAIHNYLHTTPNSLKLDVGDVVHNLLETEDWYFGCLMKNPSLLGIYPKSFICILRSKIEKTSKGETVIPSDNAIVQEAASALREWGQIWRELYVRRDPRFEKCRFLMLELLQHRSKLHSGSLTLEEERDLQQIVASCIDFGNNLLGLDMVVRDEMGNLLNTEKTSVMRLLKQHEITAQRINAAVALRLNNPSGLSGKAKKTLEKHSYMLLVTFKNFVYHLAEEAELVMFLLDVEQWAPFTENFVIRWRRPSSFQSVEKLMNLWALFSDLGNRDVQRGRVCFVCYVIRIGAMDPRQSSRKISQAGTTPLRRPYGVAAVDITGIMSDRGGSDRDDQQFAVFLPCGDEETLDSTLRRLVITGNQLKDSKGQGLWCGFRLLHGDWSQLTEENRAVVTGNPSICKKLGFPEVILPGEVRHDLYVTLRGGDFSHSFRLGNRSIEIMAQVYNAKGELNREGVIQMGTGIQAQNEYRSVVYYHEDEPKWQETFKIAIPLEQFYHSHVRLTLKHRPSNENKDKNEKPFAMAFVRLMQENGTTVKDGIHDLLVYKIDHKKFEENDVSYLKLPMTRHEAGEESKSVPGLSPNTKDFLMISTLLCSTKLTQNVHLLGLLQYKSQPGNLEQILKAFMKVDGEEIVKYIQDVFDALFSILMENSESGIYDEVVFDALVYVVGLISDRKYKHFRPMLDAYITNNFSATLAHKKLLTTLKKYLDGVCSDKKDSRSLVGVMKSLQYVFKFVVKSWQLFCKLEGEEDALEFNGMIRSFFESFGNVLQLQSERVVPVQGACLRYIPSVIPELLCVMGDMELSEVFVDVVNSPTKMIKDKTLTLDDIVRSELFRRLQCRSLLLPPILIYIKELLEKSHEMEVSSCILSSLMEVLDNIDLEFQDMSTILSIIFRPLLRTVITNYGQRHSSHLVGAVIAIFRTMSPEHYYQYIRNFSRYEDLRDFLVEILLVFTELVKRSVYPVQWSQIILVQNSVLLRALRFIATTLRDCFIMPFEYQLWENFFHCAVSFITQPSLQLESFSESKRRAILSRYRDMRREMGLEIRTAWFNLGQHKVRFLPRIVGPFLEMSLIPDAKLRRNAIPIFFDMMQCEYYSPRSLGDSYSDAKRNSALIKGHFHDLESAVIDKLSELVEEEGRGDEHYKELFESILTELCENHVFLVEQGLGFVRTVTALLERLLEYRFVCLEDNPDNQMICIANILDFYHEIGRQDMYIKYLNRLCDLHLKRDNFTEAAFTLQLHAQLLQWTDDALPNILKSSRYPECTTHRQLKEQLYIDTIDYLNRGHMWECALPLCKELAQIYEEETFEYSKLSKICSRMAAMYDSIIQQVRPEPEHFRVAFYGRGFPAILQNKEFIYRGKEFERLSDFSSRIAIEFPGAELMKTLTPPGEDVKDSPQQFLQINKVDPLMLDEDRFVGKIVNEKILRFYRVNHVETFSFSRPFHRGPRDSDNAFSSLWIERTVMKCSHPLPGILQWFPVLETQILELSPLENAIEQMQTSNRQLTEMILAHRADPKLPLQGLTMKLNGIVDPAVNGGISNYEKAFLTEDYALEHPDDGELILELKESFCVQVSLLDSAISIHRSKAKGSELPIQQRIEQCFNEMKTHVEENYGKKSADLILTPKIGKSVSRSSSKASLLSSDPGKSRNPLSLFSRSSTSFSRRTSSGFHSNRSSRNLEKRLLSSRRSFGNRYSGGCYDFVPSSAYCYSRDLLPIEAVNSSVSITEPSVEDEDRFSLNRFRHPESFASGSASGSLSRFIRETLLTGIDQQLLDSSASHAPSCDDNVPPPLPVKQKSAQ